MAHPQGRLHALRGSGLPESLSVPRCDRVIFATASSISTTRNASVAAIASKAAHSISRGSRRSTTGPTNARCAPTGSRSARGRPAQGLSNARASVFGTKEEMKDHAAGRIKDLQVARFQRMPVSMIRPVSAARTLCTCSSTPTGPNLCRTAEKSEDQPPGPYLEGPDQICRSRCMAGFAAGGVLHYMVSGPNEVEAKDEEDAKRLIGDRDDGLNDIQSTVTRSIRAIPHRRPLYAGRAGNHWITATCLVLLAISGLALFDPDLFFPHRLVWRRTNNPHVHPWIGVVLFFSFGPGFSFGSGKQNCGGPKTEHGWPGSLRSYQREDSCPEVGKYNAGQNPSSGGCRLLIIVLICTGIVIWDQYFSP